jgi:hypothetical protein
MSLASPVVSMPISTWTKTLHVTGAMPGATVLVRAIGSNPRDIAKVNGVAGGSDWLTLLPGDLLVASQVSGGSSGPWTPKESAYPVNDPESDPAKLTAVTSHTYPWECGDYVYVTGAEPGATIEVRQGGATIGTADAPLGWAWFQLTGKLVAPGPVRFRQNTPIGPGPMTDMEVKQLPFPRATPLPPPEIQGTLQGCQDLISLKGVYTGATVTLNLSTGGSYSLGMAVANSPPAIRLTAPLKYLTPNPQTVTLKQAMPKCERDGAIGSPVPVGPPEVGQPSVWGLCKGNRQVTVSGLNDKGLVTVRVFLDGTEFLTFTVHGKSVHSCDVEPLAAGDVYATQEFCGKTSVPSATVKITEHPPITQQPALVAPLYACARSVRVKDVHIGAEVQVFSKDPVTGVVTAISGRKVFLSPVDDLDVSPQLKQDHQVLVLAKGCGSELKSPVETVKPHPPIQPPTIQKPVENGSTTVLVLGLIPTAHVYVYVRDRDGVWELAGFKKPADGTSEHVKLDRVLKIEQEVAAAQYYCAVPTGRGPSVTVVKQKPEKPKLLSPPDGQKNVATGVTLTWSDPGATAVNKADSFDLTVQGTSPTYSAPGLTSTSHPVPAGVLKIGTKYTWGVVAKNSTGSRASDQWSFTTQAPKPILTAYDQATLRLKGMNFPPSTGFTLYYRFVINGELYFGDQKFITDGRQGTVPGSWNSDPLGGLDVLVDLYDDVPTLPFLVQNPSGGFYAAIKGPLKDSKVGLRAEYQTSSLGAVASDWYDFLWTRDTVLA